MHLVIDTNEGLEAAKYEDVLFVNHNAATLPNENYFK